MNKPLADRIRPTSLDEVVGQKHLLSKGKALYNLISSGDIPNLIFYGPSGVGKTTVASIIAGGLTALLPQLRILRISLRSLILLPHLTVYSFILMRYSILTRDSSKAFWSSLKTEK